MRSAKIHHVEPSEHLQKVKTWGLRPDKTIAFEQHRGVLVDALVLPFAEPTPSKQVRDNYLGFLVSNFGDPRLHSGRWTQMPSSGRVVRRWLTDQSLRQFLDVLDDSALEHQWKYRRAFWEAVYRKNLIAEAWVIFDRVGAQRARRIQNSDAIRSVGNRRVKANSEWSSVFAVTYRPGRRRRMEP